MRPPTDALVEYIETGRDRLAEAKPNPGRPTLHRLNRTEYGNAVRDLLALEIDVAELLPADDIGYGFDNIGDVLQVSPVLLERYLSVARKISRTAVGDTDDPRVLSDLRRSSRPRFRTIVWAKPRRSARAAAPSCATCSRWTASTRFRSPCNGAETTNIWASSGNASSISGSTINGSSCSPLPPTPKKVVLGSGTPPDAHLKIRVPVKAGTRELAATFLKDTLIKEGIIDRIRDDDVQTYFEGVGSITVAGPFNVQGPGEHGYAASKIFICHPSAAAERAGVREKDPVQPRPPRLSASGR